jgi:hypothetical protein
MVSCKREPNLGLLVEATLLLSPTPLLVLLAPPTSLPLPSPECLDEEQEASVAVVSSGLLADGGRECEEVRR